MGFQSSDQLPTKKTVAVLFTVTMPFLDFVEDGFSNVIREEGKDALRIRTSAMTEEEALEGYVLQEKPDALLQWISRLS